MYLMSIGIPMRSPAYILGRPPEVAATLAMTEDDKNER